MVFFQNNVDFLSHFFFLFSLSNSPSSRKMQNQQPAVFGVKALNLQQDKNLIDLRDF